MNIDDLVWYHTAESTLQWAHVREFDGDMVRVEKVRLP